jgi:uncharacterized protein (DUF2237 family)
MKNEWKRKTRQLTAHAVWEDNKYPEHSAPFAPRITVPQFGHFWKETAVSGEDSGVFRSHCLSLRRASIGVNVRVATSRSEISTVRGFFCAFSLSRGVKNTFVTSLKALRPNPLTPGVAWPLTSTSWDRFLCAGIEPWKQTTRMRLRQTL